MAVSVFDILSAAGTFTRAPALPVHCTQSHTALLHHTALLVSSLQTTVGDIRYEYAGRARARLWTDAIL
jgi:hypothetical protein